MSIRFLLYLDGIINKYFPMHTRDGNVVEFRFANLTTRMCVSLRSQFNGPRTFHRFSLATCMRAKNQI